MYYYKENNGHKLIILCESLKTGYSDPDFLAEWGGGDKKKSHSPFQKVITFVHKSFKVK